MSIAAQQPGESSTTLKFGRLDVALESVRAAASRVRDHIFAAQHPEGYWCGELEADSMLEADYIFGHTLLGTGEPGRLQRALTEMLRYQNEDGGWSIYPGGPSNISLSVKCYFACKLMGWPADEPRLARARKWILANGGVVECNTFTKIYLCFMGGKTPTSTCAGTLRSRSPGAIFFCSATACFTGLSASTFARCARWR